MAFKEIRFPTDVSWGSRGGPQHSNEIINVASGAVSVVSRLDTPRMVFDAKEALKNKDETAVLLDFGRIVAGSFSGFRFFDHVDHTTAPNHRDLPAFDDVQIGIGDGVQTQFQLFKEYSFGGWTKKRIITKPIHGETINDVSYSVEVGINGAQQSTGWSVDTTTGVITFTVPPTKGHVVTSGFAFDVPAGFGEEVDEGLLISLNDFEDEEIPSVPIYERVNETPVEDEFYFGGSVNHGAVTADVAISPLSGRLHSFSPQSAGIKCILPDNAPLALGGPWFVIENSGTQNLEVVDNLMAAVATVLPATVVEVWLGIDNASQRVWRVL